MGHASAPDAAMVERLAEQMLEVGALVERGVVYRAEAAALGRAIRADPASEDVQKWASDYEARMVNLTVTLKRAVAALAVPNPRLASAVAQLERAVGLRRKLDG